MTRTIQCPKTPKLLKAKNVSGKNIDLVKCNIDINLDSIDSELPWLTQKTQHHEVLINNLQEIFLTCAQ